MLATLAEGTGRFAIPVERARPELLPGSRTSTLGSEATDAAEEELEEALLIERTLAQRTSFGSNTSCGRALFSGRAFNKVADGPDHL